MTPADWTAPRDPAVETFGKVLGLDYRRALTLALNLSLAGVSLSLVEPPAPGRVIDASDRFSRRTTTNRQAGADA